jgi:hypothetical protein
MYDDDEIRVLLAMARDALDFLPGFHERFHHTKQFAGAS